MGKGRLEAFSDGVIAIIITIMVLELRPPEGPTIDDLAKLAPVFLAYVLSFVNVGIYWNNHHHLFQAVRVVDGRVLWQNLFLLFWLSLFPFTTAWLGETGVETLPVAAYGLVLLMASVAYYFLERALIRVQPDDAALLAQAVGAERKGLASTATYIASIVLSVVAPLVSLVLIVVIAVWWFIPDRRIERAIGR
jgi:TMEM175 potassium channel family protein